MSHNFSANGNFCTSFLLKNVIIIFRSFFLLGSLSNKHDSLRLEIMISRPGISLVSQGIHL